MPTRRDQVQSYQFMMQRVVSAFAHHDTDPVQPAGRRLFGAGLAGIMIAVLGLAGMGVYGMLRPGGNTTWRDGSSIIMEKETGTRYIYREGQLHPMANFTSAVLALDGQLKTINVAASSLLGVPRGPLLGIANAPEALPPAARLAGGPWTMCGRPRQNGDVATTASTVLRVGQRSAGRDLGDDALLVEETNGRRLFLIWHGHRHELVDRPVAMTALGLDRQPILVVPTAWVDALPAGQRLVTRPVVGRGTPSSAVPGALVGQVYVVEGAGTGQQQHYLVVDTRRVAPVTPVEAGLLLADPASRPAYPDGVAEALPLSTMQAAAAEKQPPSTHGPGAAPATPPLIVVPESPDFAICAEFNDAVNPPRLAVDTTTQQPLGTTTRRRSPEGVALADRVEVTPGWAALVEAVPTPDAPVGTRYLVTDLGVRHALANQDVQRLLGYAGVEPLRLPASMIARLPEGPALDPVAARRPMVP
ncbi:type VII secretion protein EccB [Micromonospora sonneratiae]|uniref:Type VII secretion protein EccB n=1 Tax=Micromonospora sonneratiae TaxID=1184706 RepID=A0ABW3YD13_9ACTN